MRTIISDDIYSLRNEEDVTMVLSFERWKPEERTTKEVGRIHNGEVLGEPTTELDQLVDRIHEKTRLEADDRARFRTRGSSDRLNTRTVFTRPTLSMKDELSVINYYRSPYSVSASISPPAENRDQLIASDCSDNVATPDRPDPSKDLQIRLYRAPFDSNEPIYFVAIRGDGRVFYEGRSNTPITGTYTFDVPEAVVEELLDVVYDVGFFDLDHTYIRADDPTPLPSISTGIRVGTTEKWVYNYSRHAPPAVTRVEAIVKAIAGVDCWLDPHNEMLLAELTSDRPMGPILTVLENRGTDHTFSEREAETIIRALQSAFTAENTSTRRKAVKLLLGPLIVTEWSPAEAADLLSTPLQDDEVVVEAAEEVLEILDDVADDGRSIC